ncbi:hypothetical protein GGF32_009672 [Allomyces javanicus]|nr:hypothetical protein GGF32_009672 [Allomyces javanicus]
MTTTDAAAAETTPALAAPTATTPAAAPATDKEVVTEANATCCGVIEIRVGVLVILILQLILQVIPLLITLAAAAYLGALGIIALLITVISFALTCWGLYSAIKRIGPHFKLFAMINIGLFVLGVIFDIVYSFRAWGIVFWLLRAYFCYVFWIYAEILLRANTADRGNIETGSGAAAAAPTAAPAAAAPVARATEPAAAATVEVTAAAPAPLTPAPAVLPVIAPSAEPIIVATSAEPSAPPAPAEVAEKQ